MDMFLKKRSRRSDSNKIEIVFMDNKFLFGVATASHQNEGNNYLNNWWDWEIKQKLERSGKACNSFIEYRADIDLVKGLGCNAYRFSIEWSRIYLDEYRIDEEALGVYKKMVAYCLKSNIEPIITLHHFTRPRWFDSNFGGLHSKMLIYHFSKYVETVCQEFGGDVRYWITFNEPMLECVHGYLRGERPPGKKGDFENMYYAIENIIDSHCSAYGIIKKYNRRAMVSISKNMVDFEKQYNYDLIKSNIEDQIIENYNWCILDAFYKGVLRFGVGMMGFGFSKVRKDSSWKGKLDFLGVNHYNVGYISVSYKLEEPIDVKLTMKDSGYNKNAMKWDIKPESMRNVLDGLRERYGKIKMMITESGSAEKKSQVDGNNCQKEIIDTHMRSVIEYQKKYHTILGYIVWSALDNFEWESGYSPKFGLYTMTYKKGKRMCLLKDSGEHYKEAIQKAKKQL